jgi:hypothetical protein
MIAEILDALVLLAQIACFGFLMYGALLAYIYSMGEDHMDPSKSRTHQDKNDPVRTPSAARVAILIGVLSAIFYLALAADPMVQLNSLDTLGAINYLSTTPLDSPPPALRTSHAAFQGPPKPQRVLGDIPEARAYRPNSGHGSVKAYEPD